jgi:hypothetical protein
MSTRRVAGHRHRRRPSPWGHTGAQAGGRPTYLAGRSLAGGEHLNGQDWARWLRTAARFCDGPMAEALLDVSRLDPSASGGRRGAPVRGRRGAWTRADLEGELTKLLAVRGWTVAEEGPGQDTVDVRARTVRPGRGTAGGPQRLGTLCTALSVPDDVLADGPSTRSDGVHAVIGYSVAHCLASAYGLPTRRSFPALASWPRDRTDFVRTGALALDLFTRLSGHLDTVGPPSHAESQDRGQVPGGERDTDEADDGEPPAGDGQTDPSGDPLTEADGQNAAETDSLPRELGVSPRDVERVRRGLAELAELKAGRAFPGRDHLMWVESLNVLGTACAAVTGTLGEPGTGPDWDRVVQIIRQAHEVSLRADQAAGTSQGQDTVRRRWGPALRDVMARTARTVMHLADRAAAGQGSTAAGQRWFSTVAGETAVHLRQGTVTTPVPAPGPVPVTSSDRHSPWGALHDAYRGLLTHLRDVVPDRQGRRSSDLVAMRTLTAARNVVYGATPPRDGSGHVPARGEQDVPQPRPPRGSQPRHQR